MADLDLYVEAVTRAEILGAALGVDVSKWSEAFGDDCVEDVRKSRMRRDYGLIEIFFERRAASCCSGNFSSIHRLGQGEHVVPRVLARRYGEFRSRAKFEDLRDSILH
ncbi:hypothetical protein [Streptomyces natalensis]|uniref:hypothetical protein n=1 Tax=Streptomyces natalensis TaxID=68242 RepID=UPI000ABC0FAC|nr:hypothetical protein [Streptomyces natalensis]